MIEYDQALDLCTSNLSANVLATDGEFCPGDILTHVCHERNSGLPTKSTQPSYSGLATCGLLSPNYSKTDPQHSLQVADILSSQTVDKGRIRKSLDGWDYATLLLRKPNDTCLRTSQLAPT